MYGLSAKKNGRCGEVTVSGLVVVSLIQINRTLHNLNLTSTNREKQNEFSSLQSKGVNKMDFKGLNKVSPFCYQQQSNLH